MISAFLISASCVIWRQIQSSVAVTKFSCSFATLLWKRRKKENKNCSAFILPIVENRTPFVPRFTNFIAHGIRVITYSATHFFFSPRPTSSLTSGFFQLVYIVGVHPIPWMSRFLSDPSSSSLLSWTTAVASWWKQIERIITTTKKGGNRLLPQPHRNEAEGNVYFLQHCPTV